MLSMKSQPQLDIDAIFSLDVLETHYEIARLIKRDAI